MGETLKNNAPAEGEQPVTPEQQNEAATEAAETAEVDPKQASKERAEKARKEIDDMKNNVKKLQEEYDKIASSPEGGDREEKLEAKADEIREAKDQLFEKLPPYEQDTMRVKEAFNTVLSADASFEDKLQAIGDAFAAGTRIAEATFFKGGPDAYYAQLEAKSAPVSGSLDDPGKTFNQEELRKEMADTGKTGDELLAEKQKDEMKYEQLGNIGRDKLSQVNALLDKAKNQKSALPANADVELVAKANKNIVEAESTIKQLEIDIDTSAKGKEKAHKEAEQLKHMKEQATEGKKTIDVVFQGFHMLLDNDRIQNLGIDAKGLQKAMEKLDVKVTDTFETQVTYNGDAVAREDIKVILNTVLDPKILGIDASSSLAVDTQGIPFDQDAFVETIKRLKGALSKKSQEKPSNS